MSRVDISRIATRCAVVGCSAPTTQGNLHRHHKGCEKMFVRHFADRTRSAKYKEFSDRYHSFHADDTVSLCAGHHRVVHELVYGPIIKRHYGRVDKPMCRWTWRQANILMKALRSACDSWLASTSGNPILSPIKQLHRMRFM